MKVGGGGFFVFGGGLVAGGEEQGEGGQQGKLGFHRFFRGLFGQVVMILRLWRVSGRVGFLSGKQAPQPAPLRGSDITQEPKW